MYPVRRQISPHARHLRRDQTDVEQRFWLSVRNRRLLGAKFRRQSTIGSYVVDFLCVEAMLIVELDGGQHGDDADAKRTAFLEARGYRVLRFWNNDVLQNLDGVLLIVSDALTAGNEKKTLTQPSPTKVGEG
jgi:very-short-patch-repair endonuclease